MVRDLSFIRRLLRSDHVSDSIFRSYLFFLSSGTYAYRAKEANVNNNAHIMDCIIWSRCERWRHNGVMSAKTRTREHFIRRSVIAHPTVGIFCVQKWGHRRWAARIKGNTTGRPKGIKKHVGIVCDLVDVSGSGAARKPIDLCRNVCLSFYCANT